MNVWQLDPFSLLPYYVAPLCAALAKSGCTVRYITSPYLYDSAPLAYAPDYFYFRSFNHDYWLRHPRLRRMVRFALTLPGHQALLRQIDLTPPDVIHLQFSRIPSLDLWLVRQIQKRGIPLIYTVHDIEPQFYIPRLSDLAKIHAAADRLIVHTDRNRAALLKKQPELQGKVRVVPHVAFDWSIPATASRAVARQQLGIPADAVVLLFCGSIRPYKGLDTLIDAYLRARPSCRNLRIIVTGRPDNPSWRSRLQELGDQAVVRLDYMPSDQLWLYHYAADVAVFPYRLISQSGALITAMGFGLPTIVTSVGGLAETIEDSGWVVPPDDPTALAQAIQEAASDPVRLPQMGQRALQLIREHHSPELVAAQTRAVYEESLCRESST